MLTKPLVRVFLFGNAVHELLVPLLSEKQISLNSNSGIIFVRDKKAFTNEETEFNLFQNCLVPYNTQIIVLPHDKNYADMKPHTTDSIFFVEDWTVLTNESIEIAKKYRHDYPYNELKIILFISKRKTLFPDFTNVQTTLDDAVLGYEREGFPVTTIRMQDVCSLFFWQKREYHSMLRRDFEIKLQNAKKIMESRYELHYELFCEKLKNDMISHKSLDEFLRYDETLGISKINRIIDAATKSFFYDSSPFVKELDIFFRTLTKGICLWDEKKVFDHLVSVLAQQFQKTMRQVLPPVRARHLTELSYHKFMIDTKFNVIFMQQCHVFFNDKAKCDLKLYIDNILTKMEEFL